MKRILFANAFWNLDFLSFHRWRSSRFAKCAFIHLMHFTFFWPFFFLSRMGQIENEMGERKKDVVEKMNIQEFKISLFLSRFFSLNKKANKNAHCSLMSTKNVQLSPSFFSNETPLQQKKKFICTIFKSPKWVITMWEIYGWNIGRQIKAKNERTSRHWNKVSK